MKGVIFEKKTKKNLKKNPVDIKFRHLSGMTFIKYAQNQIIGKPNNVKVHEQPIRKPKRYSENQLWLSLPDGGES
jgi:hypothetical protein